jgi:hypothetical protein
MVVDEQQRTRVLALAADFPKLWRDPKTSMRDRKRMVRLLIDDVTIVRDDAIYAHVRFRGGATRSLTLSLPKRAWELRQTPPDVIREIDAMLEHHTHSEIVKLLNERGQKSGDGTPFTSMIIKHLRHAYGLKTREQRLREAGMLTTTEIASALGVSIATIKIWRTRGLLRGLPYNDKGEWLYAKPAEDAPTKQQGRKLSERSRPSQVPPNRAKEV